MKIKLFQKNVPFLFAIVATCFAMSGRAGNAVATDGDSEVTLSNDFVTIAFSKGDNFDIKSLAINGKRLITKSGLNMVPWVLTYVGPQGENPQLLPSHAVYGGYRLRNVADTANIIFIWTLRLDYRHEVPVNVEVSLPRNSQLLYWRISSGTPAGWVVSKTQFPKITIDRPQDAKLITSAGWGAEYDLRSQTYTSNYPSWSGAMQLVLLHNADGAVYFATQDYSASGKDYRVSVTDQSVNFTTDIVNSEGWSNLQGDRYVLPWSSAIGFATEGWQAAVNRWYRPFSYTTAWGKTSLNGRNIPQWLFDTDMWIRVKGVSDAARDAVSRAIKYFGKGIGVHSYYWHHYPYDTHYPDYFPAKEGYDRWVKSVRDAGCHIVPYINGRLWDPDADSYKALGGASASCRKADGTLYTEIYPTSKVLNTVTCPASSLWRQILTNKVDSIQKLYKTNGVYIDQIAAAAPQPCWADGHGHPHGGGDYWYQGYKTLLDTLRRSHLQPGNILFSEENAECYIPMFDMLLTVNSPHSGCRIVPLFPMVYSDRLITTAFTYSPTDRVNRGDFIYETMMCFLYGSQLGWVDPTLLMKNEAVREQAFLKSLARMRKHQHDVFYGGRFVDELKITGDNPVVDVVGFGKSAVVRGTEWITSKGKRVWMVVNMDRAAHEITLPGGRNLKIDAEQAIRIDL